MTKRLEIPKKTEAFGWFGVWWDGSIGWRTPEFIHPSNQRGQAARPSKGLEMYKGDDLRRVFLCRVTIEPVLSEPRGLEARSEPITRIVPLPEEK